MDSAAVCDVRALSDALPAFATLPTLPTPALAAPRRRSPSRTRTTSTRPGAAPPSSPPDDTARAAAIPPVEQLRQLVRRVAALFARIRAHGITPAQHAEWREAHARIFALVVAAPDAWRTVETDLRRHGSNRRGIGLPAGWWVLVGASEETTRLRELRARLLDHPTAPIPTTRARGLVTPAIRAPGRPARPGALACERCGKGLHPTRSTGTRCYDCRVATGATAPSWSARSDRARVVRACVDCGRRVINRDSGDRCDRHYREHARIVRARTAALALPVVDVRAPEDRFVCERFRCSLAARSCVERQDAHHAAGSAHRRVAIHHPCGDLGPDGLTVCGQGRAVRAAVGGAK